MNTNVTIEIIDPPELVDTFYGMKTFIAAKIFWKGSWCMTVTRYEQREEGYRRSRPVVDEDEDEDIQESTEAPSQTSTKVDFSVKAKWDWIAYNQHSDENIATLEEAIELAKSYVARLERNLYAAFTRPKIKKG